MKNYRILTLSLLIVFAGGSLYHRAREFYADSRQSLIESDALHILFPESLRFSSKSGIPPHYKGFLPDSDAIDGTAVLTTDAAPGIIGYAGPIKIMAGINPDGTIRRLHIIAHSETPSYVMGLDEFLKQFESKSIRDSFTIGKDLDGITRATITSEAIARSVEKTLKLTAKGVFNLEVPEATASSKGMPLDQLIVPLVLFGIAASGVLWHKTILRWTALLGGILYFGILKSTMVSSVQIVNIGLVKLPNFQQSPLWYMLMGLTLLTTLIFGMLFCGSLCPFAGVQELIYQTARRLKLPPTRRKENNGLEQKARYTKHLLLLIILTISFIVGNANAASIEPFLTLFTRHGTTLAWMLLILMLLATIYHFRFWCKYLCPVGACLGLIARGSLYKIRLGNDCTQCAACVRICPTQAITMNQQNLPVIDAPECILCGKCIQKCPQETLNIKKFTR